jgi:hypothetical protein
MLSYNLKKNVENRIKLPHQKEKDYLKVIFQQEKTVNLPSFYNYQNKVTGIFYPPQIYLLHPNLFSRGEPCFVQMTGDDQSTVVYLVYGNRPYWYSAGAIAIIVQMTGDGQ